jgi:hypothetical protein
MKRILILALLFFALFGAFPARSQIIKPPKGFSGKLWAGTMALYGSLGQRPARMICTTTPIEKIKGGYQLLSAGHCVQAIPDGVQFFVADEVGGPLTPVTLIKAYFGGALDFSIFELKTTKKYPVFELGTESDLHIGDRTLNPNFSAALGKQLSVGRVSSMRLGKSPNCPDEGCLGRFLVQEDAAPGASGSAVFSAKTHKIVGLAVYQFDDQVGFAVEPISLFAKFLAGPNQPHPGASKSAALSIPPEEFVKLFGEEHPFQLAVLAADGMFTQAGYTFDTGLAGLQLSDELYYDVPVFIGVNEEGYFLVSTAKDNPSIYIEVVAVP